MSRIIFLSGWSNVGGSTVAFCNLVNALNEFGYDATFMGPHSYPKDNNKCKFEQVIPGSKLNVNKEDILIVHFRNNFIQRPPIKGFFLSCHEQDIFPLKNIKYEIFDKIHYVSEHQRKFHGIDHSYFILPNILEDLKPNDKPKEKIGGIIGSIDRNKQVHVSIKKALSDGCEKIYIYGLITDPWYWQNEVANLVDGEKVIYKGYEDNKQLMYNSFTDLYFSSIRECAPYVLGEAKMTNKIIHTIDEKNYLKIDYEFNKEKIVKSWIRELSL